MRVPIELVDDDEAFGPQLDIAIELTDEEEPAVVVDCPEAESVCEAEFRGWSVFKKSLLAPEEGGWLNIISTVDCDGGPPAIVLCPSVGMMAVMADMTRCAFATRITNDASAGDISATDYAEATALDGSHLGVVLSNFLTPGVGFTIQMQIDRTGNGDWEDFGCSIVVGTESS